MKNLISKTQFTSFKKSVITTAERWNDALHYCLSMLKPTKTRNH